MIFNEHMGSLKCDKSQTELQLQSGHRDDTDHFPGTGAKGHTRSPLRQRLWSKPHYRRQVRHRGVKTLLQVPQLIVEKLRFEHMLSPGHALTLSTHLRQRCGAQGQPSSCRAFLGSHPPPRKVKPDQNRDEAVAFRTDPRTDCSGPDAP